MKYFLIETDKKNHIPYSINSNRAVDIRHANRQDSHKIRGLFLILGVCVLLVRYSGVRSYIPHEAESLQEVQLRNVKGVK